MIQNGLDMNTKSKTVMATTRKAPKIEFKEREPGLPGTIGWILDRYRKTGIPKNVTINSEKFKGNWPEGG